MKRTTISLCILAALFVFPHAARAQFLFVDCSGTNPFAYPNINAALPSAGPGAFIQVTGTCNENVFIFGAQTLTMSGAATLNGNLTFFGSQNVFVHDLTVNGNLSVTNSQNVYVLRLNVTNPFGDGIDVNSSHSVGLDTINSSNNAANGLTVFASEVLINNFGTLSNNRGQGVFVGNNSLLNIGSFGGTTEISNNQSSAVGVDRSVFEALGSIHMAGNGAVAIDSRGAGRTLMFSILGLSPNIIENNPKGAVSLQETSEFSIGAAVPGTPGVISNNGPFGIEAGFGSQVTLFGVTISGHTGPGVDVYAHSQLYGAGQLPGVAATQIQNNATAGGSLNAAIRVDGNSEALLRSVTISQNNGPAILALVNSSADLAGNTFSGNTDVITCDSTSTMVSDLSIVARTPAAGVSCTTAHSLGNRAVSTPAPVVPDISLWKKMHSDYQQRSAAKQ
jgi:hypothetical protein